jgi:hypothetical protein
MRVATGRTVILLKESRTARIAAVVAGRITIRESTEDTLHGQWGGKMRCKDASSYAIVIRRKTSMEESQMGHTLTLDVPEDVYQALIQQAEQTGQPPETVAVQLLATATQNRVDDPLEQFIGALRSHAADWADQHDAYLGKVAKDSMDCTTSREHPDA